MTEREKVFARLEELGVSYEVTEHPAVFTIGEMDALGLTAKGEVCKNLFLRDAKRADLRALAAQLESSKLSFASAERLEKYLGLKQGEVTPLGVLNDADAAVEVVFDRGLERFPCLGVHPNDNTATVWLSLADILRVVEGNGNEIRWVTL